MNYQAYPRVYANSNGRGWRASYILSYDGGKSYADYGEQKKRPWAWWAILTAKSMARRSNSRRNGREQRTAREYQINRKLLGE